MTGPTFFINGRFLEQQLSGVQRYSREMLGAIDRLLEAEPAGKERWRLLTTGREADMPQLRRIEVQALPSRLHGHLWEQTVLARAARKGMLICMGGSGPVLHRPQLVVIHDASVFRHPEFYSRRYGLWHRTIASALTRRAAVATVSHFSRTELARLLNLPSLQIPVFHNGSDHMIRIAPITDAVERWRLREEPYFVVIGNMTRNKNLGVAIEAIRQVPGHALVVVGTANPRVFGETAAPGTDERVQFLGRLDDASLAGVVAQARALVFPSLYEGFGIPPLEAMVRGCPVIASDIPAVREACGDAALYFDPTDPAGLAAAMRALVAEGPEADARRRQHGRDRATAFTWEDSARRLIAHCRGQFGSGTSGVVAAG